MAKSLDAWIHNFTVTDCETHKKGYTVYKITSVIFPVFVPESLTCLTVWKRYNEVKKLRKKIVHANRSVSAPPVPPLSDDGYFRRFDADVILARKQHILNVLDYIAKYPYLYKSHAFVQFFEASQSPTMSPLKRRRDSNQCGAIEVPDTDDCLTVLSSSLASSSTISSDTTSACSEAEDATVSSPVLVVSSSRDDDVDEVDCAVEAFDDGQSECSAAVVGEQEIVPRSGSSGDYIFEAALEFSEAVRAEVARSYRPAFELYKSGIGKLIRGVRADANAERRRVAKDKINKYMLRAEQIHACHLFGSAVSRPSDAKRGRTVKQTADRLESFEELSRFKVLAVVHGVMLVQDTVDQTIYIMKTIEKPANFSVKLLEHLLPVPGMVALVRFFVSETTVYLLLQQASGGRLFDYMRTYEDTETEAQTATDKTTLNSLFCVPSHPVVALSDTDDANDSDDVDDDAFLGTLRRLRTPKRELSHSSATPNSLNEAIASMDENAPAFDMLTPGMDVSDLLNCSQKLLDSVTSTIERSYHADESTTLTAALSNPVEAILLRQGGDLSDDRRSRESSMLRRSQRMVSAKVTTTRSRASRMPLRIIVRWASELCRTISALHENGIHCGDLNASNCLLGSGGQLLLSYFHRGATSGANISPLALDGVYVAPERPLTAKSDWWSFGVLLFEMLTGERFVDCHPGGASAYYDIQYPDGVGLSPEAMDLLGSTIQSDVTRRLDGAGVRAHAFFGDIQWQEVQEVEGVNNK